MPPIAMTKKQTVIESLMSIRRTAQKLELSLRFAKKADEADKVWESTTRLSGEIDILIGRAMDDWVLDADKAIQTLGDADAELETVIGDLKKKTAIVKNVIKAIGLIDDAIDLAKKALAVI